MTDEKNDKKEIDKQALIYHMQDAIGKIHAVIGYMPASISINNANLFFNTAMLWFQKAMDEATDEQIAFNAKKIEAANKKKSQ